MKKAMKELRTEKKAIQETAEIVETKKDNKRPTVQTQHRVDQVEDWTEQSSQLCFVSVQSHNLCIVLRQERPLHCPHRLNKCIIADKSAALFFQPIRLHNS